MLLISLFMLIPMGQAANILHEGTPRLATPDDSAVRSARVNGTLTSISILEGSGCPAGTYQPGPLEPGKSLNTAVDFDPSIFLYNSTTSLNPVMCTLSIDFEFVYPEDGQADLLILTASSYTTKYEEGDEERGTNFIFKHEMLGMAGDREIEVTVTIKPG
ncbi:hypothetical protein SLS60_001988 [Paraconiothyrium brasiliense]|uniref:Uncharacterized protein n=1 Tax=Paraconiothyrium brasiliense TaxID=300254 RepID=A0ABR3S0W6_9PLEO